MQDFNPKTFIRHRHTSFVQIIKGTKNTYQFSNKIARSQGSQSFTAYTISKDENYFFYATLIHSIGPTRSHIARFARARFTLRAHENFRKKKCVSIDSKCSEAHRNAKKKKITSLTDYAIRA